MKKHDLQPSDDNIRSTFYNDSIGRNKDLVNFIKIIDSINESYSIALDSYWGSGKTFFVKQVKMILDANNEFTYDSVEGKDTVLEKWNGLLGEDIINTNYHIPIYYDAWANDNDNDPILSIVYQIIQTVGNHANIEEQKGLSSVFNIAGDIFALVKGFNPLEIAKKLKSENPLEAIMQTKSLKERIDEFIKSLIPEHGERLIIIIDELDRCNPEFAVKLLERIKHYFNNDKVTFVFTVNLAELQITIRKYYGNEFNASRYLDRFFDLRVVLPPPDMEKFYNTIGFNHRDPMLGSLTEIMKLVFKKEHMQMRDCIKFVSLMKSISFEDIRRRAYNSDGRVYAEIVIYKIIIPVVWGNMINNIFLFNSFMRENDSSLLTYFYNDRETIETMNTTLCYLYNDEEIREKRPDYSSKSGFDLLHQKLREFYRALMISKDEVEVGKCYITDRERDIFHRTVSLLSGNIMLEENKEGE